MQWYFKNNDSGSDKKCGIVFASIGFVATNPLGSRKEVKTLAEKRQHRYAFYLDDEENEMLLSQTKEYNISVSKLIRLLILYQCIKFPPKEIRSVVPELRRIGNNLNQIARALNSKSYVTDKEIRNAISELRNCERQLLKNFDTGR